MDFEKIKPAVEEIKLSEIRQERIIEACEKHKKKSFNYKVWIPVAAALFAVVIFSPGFIFRAGSKAEDAAAPESANGIYYNNSANNQEIHIDEELLADEIGSDQEQSTAAEVRKLFESGVYREVYSVIPSQFIWLADAEEYENWEKTVSASGGMAILQFVEHFGITREEFDSANEAYEACIRSSGENLEVFNADIIYSFDRTIIDEYYSAQ